MKYNLIKKKLFQILKKVIYQIFGLVFFLEFFFQIIFFIDIKSFKKPILFFNPFCDQAYWNSIDESSFDKKIYIYHPKLTMIKKINKPNFKKKKLINYNSINKDLIFYGSSFIDHKYFIHYYRDDINYAVRSYGLDQIYTSYNLTKNQHYNDIIIFGFLLEDLDRVIFKKRNFTKLKFVKTNNTFQMTNIPIKLDKKVNNVFSFYTYNFIKNLFFLKNNNYDYKHSNCKVNTKKDLFKYFINEIIKNSHELNQKVIFITFNFKEDFNNEKNWRYPFIKNKLLEGNVIHIDSKEIISQHMKKNNLEADNYYSKNDLHLNKLGNSLVTRELEKAIELYR